MRETRGQAARPDQTRGPTGPLGAALPVVTVHVRGGVVQEVEATGRDVVVIVRDHDDEAAS